MPAKVFTEADDPDIAKWLKDLRADNHPGLDEAKVTVAVLFVEEFTGDGEATGEPCLELNGYGAAATIKINSYKSRVEGLKDATLTIDKVVWESLDQGSKVALLDHELLHLQVKQREGTIRRDDCGRPLLKLKKHDFHFGGFHTICKRHGGKALEFQAVGDVLTHWRQLELAFG